MSDIKNSQFVHKIEEKSKELKESIVGKDTKEEKQVFRFDDDSQEEENEIAKNNSNSKEPATDKTNNKTFKF